METVRKCTKITIGQLELWTAPFGNGKATITATEKGTKMALLHLHQKHPEHFQTLVDDDELCTEDMEGAFSVIVDPELLYMVIRPGDGQISFGVRACDLDEEEGRRMMMREGGIRE